MAAVPAVARASVVLTTLAVVGAAVLILASNYILTSIFTSIGL